MHRSSHLFLRQESGFYRVFRTPHIIGEQRLERVVDWRLNRRCTENVIFETSRLFMMIIDPRLTT